MPSLRLEEAQQEEREWAVKAGSIGRDHQTVELYICCSSCWAEASDGSCARFPYASVVDV